MNTGVTLLVLHLVDVAVVFAVKITVTEIAQSFEFVIGGVFGRVKNVSLKHVNLSNYSHNVEINIKFVNSFYLIIFIGISLLSL